MKIFKKFIFSSFIYPFLLTFSIVVLILLMQFLWKYIDDLVGKGLDFSIILELLSYSTITLIPLALPLSILLASMMLTGGMSERSEITAINALGQPFTYLISPMFLFSTLIAIVSFSVSNYAIPYCNLKATNLMYDIMQKKLNINIQENVFFSEIEGYSIRVEKKESDGLMTNVIIYDYSDKKGINKVFSSKKAKISTTRDNSKLIIQLFNGEIYNEVIAENEDYIIKTNFNEYNLTLDLSSFKMERTTSDRFSNRAKTMNLNQLKTGIDSLINEQTTLNNKIIAHYTLFQKETTHKQDHTIIKKKQLNKIEKKIRDFQNYTNQKNLITKKINRFQVEWHRKFTLSIACIIMLIIGAPIGAIIRKGGFGLPVIFSIILFLIYHVISITGEKMVKKGLIEPVLGMWSSTYIMLIIGIVLIIMVNKSLLLKNK